MKLFCLLDKCFCWYCLSWMVLLISCFICFFIDFIVLLEVVFGYLKGCFLSVSWCVWFCSMVMILLREFNYCFFKFGIFFDFFLIFVILLVFFRICFVLLLYLFLVSDMFWIDRFSIDIIFFIGFVYECFGVVLLVISMLRFKFLNNIISESFIEWYVSLWLGFLFE